MSGTGTASAAVVERAPAKVILVGEHAVVFGHPAIALPFPALSVTATATPREAGFTLRSDRYPTLLARLDEPRDVPGVLAPVAEAVRGALEAMGRTGASARPFDLEVSSPVPPGAGLGSSASVAVAAIRAVFAYHGRQAPAALVRMLATQAEAIAHGTSSGLDPAAVAAEGPIRFVRDHAPVVLRVPGPFGLVVADSGEAAATSVMVERVRARKETHEAAERSLQGLGELSEQAVVALEAGDYPALGGALDAAHGHLATLGVSTARLDALVHAARAAGAHGAKLSGAGGGGCAIALCPLDRLQRVAEAMVAAGAVAAWPSQYLLEGA